MADIGQELALGEVGLFRGFLGVAQGFFGALAVGNVVRDSEGSDDLSFLIAQRHFGAEGPGDAAIRPGFPLFLRERATRSHELLLVFVSLSGVLA